MPSSTDFLRLLHLRCDITLSKPTFAVTRHHHSTTIRDPGIIRPTVQVCTLQTLPTTPRVVQDQQLLQPIPTVAVAWPTRYRTVTMGVPVMETTSALTAPRHKVTSSAHAVPILHWVSPISNSHKHSNNLWTRCVNIIIPPTRIVRCFDA